MPHKPNFTAQLSNKAAIIKVAASVGCIQTTGSQAGKGSIRKMLEEIAAGTLVVVRPQSPKK